MATLAEQITEKKILHFDLMRQREQQAFNLQQAEVALQNTEQSLATVGIAIALLEEMQREATAHLEADASLETSSHEDHQQQAQ